jgi:hypothetical protein
MVMKIVKDQIGPFNPNLTPYILGIAYNGTNYPSQLIYTPNNPGAPIPTYYQDPPSFYYFVNTYDLFINMMNAALLQSWINSGLSAIFPLPIRAPYIEYNSSTSLLSVVVPKCFSVITAPLIEIPKIYLNVPMIQYFMGFSLYFYGINKTFGRDADIILSDPISVAPYQLIPLPSQLYLTDYYKFTQDFSSLPYFASIRKILITSNTIPINAEVIPPPYGSSISTTLPIITDFVIPIETIGSSKSIAIYNPSAQYRLIDMIGSTPLHKLDLNIMWEDLDGNIYPLYLSIFQQISIKIGFFRKSLYKDISISPK